MHRNPSQRSMRVRQDSNEFENGYWRELTDEEIGRQQHREFVGGLWDEIGELQFDFLVAQGLRPEHTLLDMGCGALRGGVHFVRYLAPGHYFGIDRNQSLIRAGHLEMEKQGVSDRNATLRVSSTFDAPAFGVEFDYVLAVSLFTHLHANHIVRCLSEVGRSLREGGAFYATFFEASTAAHLGDVVHDPGGVTTHFDADPFHYSLEEMSTYARFAGLRTDYIGEWTHPRAQRMLRFQR